MNTTAEVRIPAANRWAVTEGGKPISEVDDVTYVKEADGDVVLEVGSGRYAFAIDQVLGDLGAARAQAASFADDVDALQVRGLGKIAKGHLQMRTALMRTELTAAWRLQSEGADERLTAAAVHRALMRRGRPRPMDADVRRAGRDRQDGGQGAA